MVEAAILGFVIGFMCSIIGFIAGRWK